MINTFFGLEIGRKALQAQQRALEVTAHNIANANTEGYTRQQPVFSTTTPYSLPAFNRPLIAGQVGTGVYIQEIRRLRDSFIDAQFRKETTATGYWEVKEDVLNKLEAIINEPSDVGLRSVWDQFWQALQDLSLQPESMAVRSLVRERGIALADTFNHLDRQLSDLAQDLDSSVRVKIEEINNLAAQIAELNGQIVKIEVSGDKANDLRDKRDLLIDQLARLVNIEVVEPPDQHGAVVISVGGRVLVMNQQAYALKALDNTGNFGYADVVWADNLQPVFLSGGSLKALLEMRDGEINGPGGFRALLDKLAASLISAFNTIHAAGFGLDGSTGNNFFTGTGAGDIALDPTILASLDKIAAASEAAGLPGDGSNALRLAQLKHQAVIGSDTFDDYLRGFTAQLGVKSQGAKRMVTNQELLLAELTNRRQSVSGVSLDEEMTNMIRFQHAYNAAARLITAIDEMLDTLINRLGLAGR